MEIQKWLKNKGEIRKFSDSIRSLFGAAWESDSAWRWIVELESEFNKTALEKTEFDVDAAYLYSISSFVDFAALNNIEELTKTISTPILTANAGANKDRQYTAAGEINKLCRGIELTDLGINMFAESFIALSEAQQTIVKNNLAELSMLYLQLKESTILVASALQYFSPANPVTTLATWKKACEQVKNGEKSLQLSILRYLGESVRGKDYGMIIEAVDALLVNRSWHEKNDDLYSALCGVMQLYLAFCQFGYLLPGQQNDLLSHCALGAIVNNVPVAELIKVINAEKPLLPQYIITSGTFAVSLEESKELITGSQVTVGEFIKKYQDFAGNEDLNREKQKNFITKFLSENKINAGLDAALSSLLNLYLHLRECDLIDYHRMLSDGGVKKKDAWDNWPFILTKDLSDIEIQDLKRHLQILHLPLRVKVEMIVAIEQFPWQSELYLSRVIALSNLYEEVYPDIYGPIIFFDSNANVFKLNKALRRYWQQEY